MHADSHLMLCSCLSPVVGPCVPPSSALLLPVFPAPSVTLILLLPPYKDPWGYIGPVWVIQME